MASETLRWLVVLPVCLSGCVDPAGTFEAYTDRANQVPTPEGGSGSEAGADCVRPDPEEIAPEYVFTMSMRLTPGQAFLGRGAATAATVGDELHIDLDIDWLAAGDRATPVGDPIAFGPIIVDAEGYVRTDPAMYTLPAEANPALCGIAISATSALQGRMCKPTDGEMFARTACGDMVGTLHPPPIEQDLEAAGGNFRLVALGPDGTLPEELIGCAGEPLDAPQCM